MTRKYPTLFPVVWRPDPFLFISFRFCVNREGMRISNHEDRVSYSENRGYVS